MSAAVADTHAVVWYLTGNASLSSSALAAFDSAAATGNPVWIPSICLVEITYLAERGRLPLAALQRLRAAVADPNTALRLAVLDLDVVDALAAVPRHLVPDMPDRIIAATAVARRLPLITRDSKIRGLPITSIW